MSKYTFAISVESDSEEGVASIRERLLARLTQCSSAGTPMNYIVGAACQLGTPRHQDLVLAAREIYAEGSDDDIEVDPDAIISEGGDGIWVQGWLFLPNEVLDDYEIHNPERANGPDGDGDDDDDDDDCLANHTFSG
jgi:hypothetical protein